MSSYDGYSAIAGVYDELNKDIDYSAWADMMEKCFERFGTEKPEIILDLACGTGRMTRELAARGYDMIGVDGSADMLNEAYMRGAEGILYLLQDMREFELYGTVGATVCCLDSLNYLLDIKDLYKTFSLVHNYSDPDALFLFDMNTPYKFEKVYADNAYVLESEDEYGAVYCGWQNFYDAQSKICDFYLSVFKEDENGRYLREDEQQKERCYTKEEILEALSASGFELVDIYRDYEFGTPDRNTERWYFVARAKK
jgi:ubiquinone/menaquinone biosynthesis C-methylase UbiE